MATFNVKDFCDEPSLTKLIDKNPTKLEWQFIAMHFNIQIPNPGSKEQIKNVVVESLVNSDVLPEEAIDELTPMSKSLNQSGVELNATVAETWSEARIAFEREKLAFESKKLEQEERIQMQQLEYEQKTLEFKMQQLEHEKENRESKRIQLELKLADQEKNREFKKQQKELEVEKEKAGKTFNLAKSIPLVPPFLEKDPEGYFSSFEEIAKHLKWPKEEWAWLLQPKLSGKAASVVGNLTNKSDYEFVKKAVLDAFEITPEFYRRKFRNLLKLDSQTFLDFANDKLKLLKKWLKAQDVNNFSDLVNLIVIEEWKRRLPFNILLHVEDKGEMDLIKAARMADAYSLIHKNHPREKQKNVKLSSGNNLDSGFGSKSVANTNVTDSKVEFCTYCKKYGHTILSCTHPNCKTSAAYKIAQAQSSKKSLDNSIACFNMATPGDIFAPFKSVVFINWLLSLIPI